MGFILELIFLAILILFGSVIAFALHFMFGAAGWTLLIASVIISAICYAVLLWWDQRN